MDKIRVEVADDHTLFAEVLRQLLSSEDDIECVALATDGLQAVKLAREFLPDVVLMDVAMPQIDGIEAAKQIKSTCSEVAIVMVSACDYDEYVTASIQAGASGYLLKNTHLSDIVTAVHTVHAGGQVFGVRPVTEIHRELESNLTANFHGLHERELQMLKLACCGMENKQIATELSISKTTVITHLHHAYQKLRVRSRNEAISRLLAEGWFTAEYLASVKGRLKCN